VDHELRALTAARCGTRRAGEPWENDEGRLRRPTYGAKPVVGSVDFAALVGDGVDLLTFHVDVEIAAL
jgi:hypothetical protein